MVIELLLACDEEFDLTNSVDDDSVGRLILCPRRCSRRRFFIEDGVVWQLIDEDGAVRGQAATFAKWRDA